MALFSPPLLLREIQIRKVSDPGGPMRLPTVVRVILQRGVFIKYLDKFRERTRINSRTFVQNLNLIRLLRFQTDQKKFLKLSIFMRFERKSNISLQKQNFLTNFSSYMVAPLDNGLTQSIPGPEKRRAPGQEREK